MASARTERSGRGSGVGLLIGLGLLLLGGGGARQAARSLGGGKGKPRTGRLPGWPLDPSHVTRVGESLGTQRVQHTHQGLDLFAPAGTAVIAPDDLVVIRVINGSEGESASQRRAGMWLDAESGGQVLRFLHLQLDPPPPVHAGQALQRGDVLGHVATTGTSGLFEAPSHLHFEVRQPGSRGQAYGDPIDPLRVLPPVGIAALDERLTGAGRRT